MTPQEKDHYTKLAEHYNSDRDCPTCIHHTENGCRKWDCEYEKLMSIQDAILALKMVEAHGIADKAKETAIRSLEAWEKVRTEIKNAYCGITSYHDDRPWLYQDEVLAIIDKALGEIGEKE